MDHQYDAATAADPAASDTAADPETPAPERPMFDKPNLQLKDPDPYAFANRIRRLMTIACVMACIAVAPFMGRMIAYQARQGQMMAEVDVIRSVHGDITPQLVSFEHASRSIVKRIAPCVVSIYLPNIMGPDGEGSGFIVDEEGYVVTNYHVVKRAQRLLVRFADGSSSEAAIVGVDPATDLAVLKVDGGELPAVDWGDSASLEAGNFVWAFGSPFGLDQSITFGIVSSTARRHGSGVTEGLYQEYLQTDAAVNPGNSGGPLVNLAGEVVGVNTAIVGDSYQGVSFAIPSTLAREKYEQIREHGFVERGFLGIEPARPSQSLRSMFALGQDEGVLIRRVNPDSPADIAQLMRGDIILSWNDHKAHDPTLLSRAIAATEVGSMAEVKVRRKVDEGDPVDLTLTVRVGRNVLTEARPE